MSAVVKGEGVGEYMEADIPGYYHRVTFTDGEDFVAFDFLPTYKDVAGVLVPITEEEAHQAYLTKRVKGR